MHHKITRPRIEVLSNDIQANTYLMILKQKVLFAIQIQEPLRNDIDIFEIPISSKQILRILHLKYSFIFYIYIYILLISIYRFLILNFALHLLNIYVIKLTNLIHGMTISLWRIQIKSQNLYLALQIFISYWVPRKRDFYLKLLRI